MMWNSLDLEAPSIDDPTLGTGFSCSEKKYISQQTVHTHVISNFLESPLYAHLHPQIFILYPIMEYQYWSCVSLSAYPLKHSWRLPCHHNCFILYDYKTNIKYMMTSYSDFLSNRLSPVDHSCTGVWVPGFLSGSFASKHLVSCI